MKEQNFKNTEIGLIPEDWEVKELEDLSKDLIRGPFGGALKKEFFVKNGIKIYEQKNAIYKSVKLGNYYIDNNKFKELQRFEIFENDFILSCSGTIGKIFKIPKKHEKGIINQALLILRLNRGLINLDFFEHIFNDEKIQRRIIDDTQGGAMKNLVGMSEFRKTKFPLPPLSEQEKIAEALSDCDGWIESIEQLIAKKRQLKQGAMQKLLSPKEDWEVRKLGEVVDVFRGGSPRPIQNYMTNESSGINWIKIGDTSSGGKYILSAREKIISTGEKYSRKVSIGDFLLSNSMSFGRPYILKIDGCIHDGWLVLQNYQENFDTEFLYYLLSSETVLEQYKSKAAGSSVLNLSKDLVSSVELTFPNLKTQTEIATILSDMDAEIETLEEQLQKAKNIKLGMMQDLLTGKVRLM